VVDLGQLDETLVFTDKSKGMHEYVRSVNVAVPPFLANFLQALTS